MPYNKFFGLGIKKEVVLRKREREQERKKRERERILTQISLLNYLDTGSDLFSDQAVVEKNF